MQSNNSARKILIIAITIIVIFLALNIGLVIRINQLTSDRSNLEKTIATQEETIARYESSSSTNLDETTKPN